MRRILFITGMVVLALFTLSVDCTESLPPYSAPGSIFSLDFRCDQPNPDFIQRDIDNILAAKGAISFSMDITNIFDETLQGAVMNPLGEVTIWWKDDPNVQATLNLTALHEVVTDELADPQHVTFDPGDMTTLCVVWQYWQDDQDNYVWDHVFPSYRDGQYRYGPMTFIAQARVRLAGLGGFRSTC